MAKCQIINLRAGGKAPSRSTLEAQRKGRPPRDSGDSETRVSEFRVGRNRGHHNPKTLNPVTEVRVEPVAGSTADEPGPIVERAAPHHADAFSLQVFASIIISVRIRLE